jgi:hypothetical protein
MFGVKIHPHRSLLIVGVIICFFLIFVFLSDKKVPSVEKLSFDTDEDINLIELFNHAFKLTYQAGQAIKLFKNTKTNFAKILKKKSFENLSSEPVTIADLISHSIITNGLKNKFANLQVCSEIFSIKELIILSRLYLKKKIQLIMKNFKTLKNNLMLKINHQISR